MARYIGPKAKLARREGTDLFLKSARRTLDSKCKIETKPGQHGAKSGARTSDYGLQLRKKQKLKRMLSLAIGFMGFIAGIVACLFAEVISAVPRYRMDLMLQPHWEIWLILPVFMTVLCALIGRYRLSYLCDIPPLQSLREMNQS